MTSCEILESFDNLPAFKYKNEESSVLEILSMWDHLYKMRDLAFTIKPHQNILDHSNANELDISEQEFKFYLKFVQENEGRVTKYKMATLTPVEIINKNSFLEGLQSNCSNHLEPRIYSLP